MAPGDGVAAAPGAGDAGRWPWRVRYEAAAGIVLALLLVLTGCTPAEPQARRRNRAAEPVYMALTFDDGPSPSNTPRLLEGLSRRGVRATFFLVGSRIEGRETWSGASGRRATRSAITPSATGT